MGTRGLTRAGIKYKNQLQMARLTAEQFDIPIERVVEIAVARKEARRAKFYRGRQRRRTVEKKKSIGIRRFVPRKFGEGYVYAGEGELEPLMRVCGMTMTAFCKLAGIATPTFYRWYGHPLFKWPIELVRYYTWATRMAARLRELGEDPDALMPQVPTKRHDRNKYPRTSEDGEKYHIEPEAK